MHYRNKAGMFISREVAIKSTGSEYLKAAKKRLAGENLPKPVADAMIERLIAKRSSKFAA